MERWRSKSRRSSRGCIGRIFLVREREDKGSRVLGIRKSENGGKRYN